MWLLTFLCCGRSFLLVLEFEGRFYLSGVYLHLDLTLNTKCFQRLCSFSSVFRALICVWMTVCLQPCTASQFLETVMFMAIDYYFASYVSTLLIVTVVAIIALNINYTYFASNLLCH